VVLLVVCGGLMSILIPSLNRAREQANRVKSASNLQQIGLAALMYANVNQDHFPDDEKAIVKMQQVPISDFVSPRTKTGMPTMTDPDKQAEWVNANSDYAWVGAGLNDTGPGNAVLAYEKPDGLQGGIEVLFADGHVEWVAKPKSDAMVSELKQGRNPPPSLALP
jgi:prepilin-type processing-associated H-X9-DG protein